MHVPVLINVVMAALHLSKPDLCLLHAVSATLVLREMQQQQLQSLDRNPADFLQPCDMAAFVFDGNSMESFQAARELVMKLSALANDGLPCVMVASIDQAGLVPVSHTSQWHVHILLSMWVVS